MDLALPSLSNFFKAYKIFVEKLKEFYESEDLPNFVPVGIGFGIYCYFILKFEPKILYTLVSFFAVLFLHFKNILPKFFSYILFTFALGFLCANLRTIKFDTYMLAEKTKPLNIEGNIEACEISNSGLSFIIKNVSIKEFEKIKKLQLTWKTKDPLNDIKKYQVGAKILTKARLYPIRPPAFFKAYDFKKQRYFENISAQGFLSREPEILESKPKYIENFRSKINRIIEANVKAPSRGILKALITGTKSEISKNIRDDFAASGIAHILAISGLHMGIIGFFVFAVVRFILTLFLSISMYFDTKKIAALISLLFTCVYLFISGASIPSIRAFIMHAIVIIAILVEKKAFSMRSVAIAATIIMMFMPETIMFPSFQMSFSAVIALIAFYEANSQISKKLNLFGGVILTTIIASIPTSLFSTAFFNQVTVNGVFANLIAIPLMSFFLMPLVVLLLIFMFTSFAGIIFVPIEHGIQFLIKIAHTVAALPGSAILVPTPSTLAMAIIIISSLWLALFRNKIRRLGGIGIILGITLYIFEPRADIFISDAGQLLGIKNKDVVCFNNLKSLKSVANNWAKSVGSSHLENFNSERCASCVSKIDDFNYVCKIKNKKILISSDRYFSDENPKANKTIENILPKMNYVLNFNSDSSSKLFFAGSPKIIQNPKHRPWS